MTPFGVGRSRKPQEGADQAPATPPPDPPPPQGGVRNVQPVDGDTDKAPTTPPPAAAICCFGTSSCTTPPILARPKR